MRSTREDVAGAATPPAEGGGGRGRPPHSMRRSRAYVVVTHAKESTHLGRRFGITADDVTHVGSVGEGIVLAAVDEVAPRHLTFEWRTEKLWLVPHAERLLLDGTPVLAPCGVRSSARVDVGGAVLSVIMGERLEAQYYELIYQMATTDIVTGVLNSRALEEWEGRAVEGARRAAVVTLELNVAGGPFDTNRALERTARALEKHAENRVVGRSGALSFDILCNNLSPIDADPWAAELVARLEDDGLPVTIAGVRLAQASGLIVDVGRRGA